MIRIVLVVVVSLGGVAAYMAGGIDATSAFWIGWGIGSVAQIVIGKYLRQRKQLARGA